MGSELYAKVQSLLVKPRHLSARVGSSISMASGKSDPLEGLQTGCLEILEPFEVEILLAPVFTPSEHSLEACECVLPPSGIPEKEVDQLVVDLIHANLRCPLMFGQDTVEVLIPEVVIERYVPLLHLSNGIDPCVLEILEKLDYPKEDRDALYSFARNGVWSSGVAENVLKPCLQVLVEKGTFQLQKIRFLTAFVGSYRPSDVTTLLQALSNLIEAYHQDNEHPIYNVQLEHYQGDSIRSQFCGTKVKAFRLSMARALLSDFDRTFVFP